MKKRKIISIVLIIIILFGVYNIIWYFGSYKIYKDYQKGFPEIAASGVKIYVDEEQYQYSVSLPKYLMWNGNLAISEENVNYALIIWLTPFGKERESGIILQDVNGVTRQIELKDSVTAVRKEEQEIVDSNRELVRLLYEKANNTWNLELK